MWIIACEAVPRLTALSWLFAKNKQSGPFWHSKIALYRPIIEVIQSFVVGMDIFRTYYKNLGFSFCSPQLGTTKIRPLSRVSYS